MSIENFLQNQGKKEMHETTKMSFPEYFSYAVQNPHVTQLSTQRVYKMILSHGVKTREDGTNEYLFFKNKIFGAEQQIQDIMYYLKAASLGLDIKKRVLLLLGPPGGGKSQILSLIKKGLSAYSHTKMGEIYAIDGCPINEEPFHLIPDSERDEYWRKYKIKIEGKLCPSCQFEFENNWKKNINNVSVKRIFINENNRIGIGTFAPAERNDMSELYGSENLSTLEYYGNSGDKRAYTFNGELHIANRGVMEFIEVLKANPAFLHVLLTLAEEQMFKVPRFPLQYVDECLIAHTNESEFYRFIHDPQNEAIVDRLFIVRVPYNMDYRFEELIYHSALKTKLIVQDVTVQPGAVRFCSLFAIKTRLHKEDKLREGMIGISPRFILNALAIALVKSNTKVVKAIDMFHVLYHQIENYPVLNDQTRSLYLNFLDDLYLCIDELNKLTMDDVMKFESNDKKNIYEEIIGSLNDSN